MTTNKLPNPKKPTPAEIDMAIAEIMQTGMTGLSFQIILASLRKERENAIKNLK